jgi:hypothetical protein
MVSTAGGIVIAIVVIIVAAAVGWVVFSQLRARRLGVSFDPFALCFYFYFYLFSPLFSCFVPCVGIDGRCSGGA